MATDTVDLTVVGKTLEPMRAEQRAARKEQADIRQLARSGGPWVPDESPDR